jgi:hypothetical protein
MAQGDVNFLHQSGHWRADNKTAVAKFRHEAAFAPGQTNGEKAVGTGRLQGFQHIGAGARSGEGEKNIAPLPKGLHLLHKHLIKAEIVADGRKGRAVGGQGNGRQGRTVDDKPVDKFCGKVLAVGRAAAVAAKQNLVATGKGHGQKQGAGMNTPGLGFKKVCS